MSRKGEWLVARFTWNGKEYKKSLKTKDNGDAKAALRDVENRIHDLHRNKIQLPIGVDPGDFIVWGENAKSKSAVRPIAPTFGELATAYLEAQKGFKAESTMVTERIHLGTAQEVLGKFAQLPVDQLRHRDLAAILHKRLQQVTDTTAKKERQTLISVFAWAVQQEILDSSPAVALPIIKADCDRPPFRTWGEIEEMLKQGGLDDSQTTELWECLYLTPGEIAEILALVKQRANPDFAYPMFALIAYTGIRRGEMLRLRWLDVDFRRKSIIARSLKQSRQKRETSRDIDLHPELESVLAAYYQKRRSGSYVICRDKAVGSLTKQEASDAFRRSLQGTRWERRCRPAKPRSSSDFTPSGTPSPRTSPCKAWISESSISGWATKRKKCGNATSTCSHGSSRRYPEARISGVKVGMGSWPTSTTIRQSARFPGLLPEGVSMISQDTPPFWDGRPLGKRHIAALLSPVSPSRCSGPASVTLVSDRPSDWNLASLLSALAQHRLLGCDPGADV